MRKITLLMALALIISAVNAQETLPVLNSGRIYQKIDAKFNKNALREQARLLRAEHQSTNLIEVNRGGSSRVPITGNLIFSDGFEGTTGVALPTGWTATNSFGTGTPTATTNGAWMTTGTTVHGGSRTSLINLNAASPTQNWGDLFSPNLTLEAGKTYELVFWGYEGDGTSTTMDDILIVNLFNGNSAVNKDTVYIADFGPFQGQTPVSYLAWAKYRYVFKVPVTANDYCLEFLAGNLAAFGVTGYRGGNLRVDDISINELLPKTNDLAISIPEFPFSQVPIAQGLTPTNLTATISNVGANAQNNVSVEVKLNGTTVGTSAPITLAEGESQTITIPVSGTTVYGNNDLTYTVSAAGLTDADPSDNVATTTITVSGNTMAVDNGSLAYQVGTATTSTNTYGNVFTFSKSTDIYNVTIRQNRTSAANFNLAFYSVTAPNTVAATPIRQQTITSGSQQVRTTYTLTTPLTVAAGSYYVCITEPDNATTASIIADNAVPLRNSSFQKSGTGLTLLPYNLDIRVNVDYLNNDIGITATPPFSRVPADQAAAMTLPNLVATLSNVGLQPQTQVKFSTTLNGNAIGTSPAITSIASLASSTATLVPSPNTMPTTLGTHTLSYAATQAETDQNPANNTATATFEITNNVYAVDNTPEVPPGGFGSSTSGSRLGNVFNITAATLLDSINVAWASGSALAYSIGIYTMTGATSFNTTALATLTGLTRPATAGWQKVPANVILVPGSYFVCLISSNTTNYSAGFGDIMNGVNAWSGGTSGGTLTVGNSSVGPMGIRLITKALLANDMSATFGKFPYTMIPTSQAPITPFTATATNRGTNDQTNVTLSVDLQGATIATSTPVGPITTSQTQSLTATPVAGLAVVLGTNTLTNKVSSDYFTGVNAITNTQSFLGTPNIYAKDNPTSTSVNSNIGSNATTGHIFSITSTVNLAEIQAEFNATTGTAQVYLQSVTGTTLSAATGIINNVTFTRTAAGWNTYKPASPITLTPGTYYLGIAQSGATAVSLRYDATAGGTFYTKASLTGTALTTVTSTTALGMPRIRMVFQLLDAAVTAITAPVSGSGLTATEPVTATIKNNSNVPISTFDLELKVDGVSKAIEPYTGAAIAAGASANYTFTTATADLSAVGNHTICAGVILVGDQDASNDEFCTPVIHKFTDAAVTAITDPVAGCLTAAETVIATITNNGTDPITSIDMELVIDGVVKAYETVNGATFSIAPGASYNYSFTTTADFSLIHSYVVDVTAYLLGDEVATNNTNTVTIEGGCTNTVLNQTEKVTIYPNPVTDNVVIENAFGSHARIYDISGKIVFETNITNTAQSVNISSISAGVYFLELQNNNSVSRVKLIKK